MKKVLWIIVGLALALSACGGGGAPATLQPTAAPSQPTSAPAASATTPPSAPSQYKLEPAAACQPDAGPEPVPGIPPANADDWTKGAATASVVLLEYGDYQ
jgi:hypothetical protein